MKNHVRLVRQRRYAPRVYGRGASAMSSSQETKAQQRQALVGRLIAEHPELGRLAIGAWPEEFLKQVKPLL